jgi:proteic killer suppression protein
LIESFRCPDARAIFLELGSRKFRAIERQAKRRLDILHAATSLQDLAAIRSNHLEALKHDRAGQYSIRINDQFRVCFRWQRANALDVEIVDYH